METAKKRGQRFHRRRTTVTWPLTGASGILRRQASQFTPSPDQETIRDDSIQLENEESKLSVRFIERQLNELRGEVDQRIE